MRFILKAKVSNNKTIVSRADKKLGERRLNSLTKCSTELGASIALLRGVEKLELLMLRFTIITLCIFIFQSQAHALENVQGTGIHRANETSCLQGLPKFKSRLEQLGLHLETGDVECQSVAGEPDAFEPAFKAAADKPVLIETALGVPSLSNAHCERNLNELLAVVADDDEVIVESGCVQVNTESAESEETTSKYQAMVILMKLNGDRSMASAIDR